MKTFGEFLIEKGYNWNDFDYNFQLEPFIEEYTELQCDLVHDLFNKPAKVLEPLQDLYIKENPNTNGKYYIPDRTMFYKWIVKKMTYEPKSRTN